MRTVAVFLQLATACLVLTCLGEAQACPGQDAPCDKPRPGDTDDRRAPAPDDPESEPTDHQHPKPCTGADCTDTCWDCGCCAATGIAQVPELEISSDTPGVCSPFVPDDDPAFGFHRGVYRPPRSTH